ncbi:MAG: aldose 1-epimerase family protein [Clostridiales bacterium]|jgi:galactose mutarotase-like enzyme|nr:aldose 1-epimerase family protein [Clostridiales bacterium]
MELFTVKNENLSVRVSPLGAEMQSIKGKDGREYLWYGDPAFWNRRAINLFPYIARLTAGKYSFEGKEYPMTIHGFLPESVLNVESRNDTEICFLLTDNEETRAIYPFNFELRVGYALSGNTIHIRFDVRNTGGCPMHFGIGGHPGFLAPMEDGLTFTDYVLEFDRPCKPLRAGFSERCFVDEEKTEEYPLTDGRIIPLRHNLFDHDAIVLRGTSGTVTLKSAKGTKSVTVRYPDMPYVGFWHTVKKEAPYVCVEPWSSLPSRDGIVEDISRQDNLIHLPAGEQYVNNWSIEINQ